MPTYNLKCIRPGCGERFEATCSPNKRREQRCPKCKGFGKVIPSGTPHFHPTKGVDIGK